MTFPSFHGKSLQNFFSLTLFPTHNNLCITRSIIKLSKIDFYFIFIYFSIIFIMEKIVKNIFRHPSYLIIMAECWSCIVDIYTLMLHSPSWVLAFTTQTMYVSKIFEVFIHPSRISVLNKYNGRLGMIVWRDDV